MGQSLSFPFSGKGRPTDPEDGHDEKAGLPVCEPEAQGGLSAMSERERLTMLQNNCYIQPHTDEGGDAY